MSLWPLSKSFGIYRELISNQPKSYRCHQATSEASSRVFPLLCCNLPTLMSLPTNVFEKSLDLCPSLVCYYKNMQLLPGWKLGFGDTWVYVPGPCFWLQNNKHLSESCVLPCFHFASASFSLGQTPAWFWIDMLGTQVESGWLTYFISLQG